MRADIFNYEIGVVHTIDWVLPEISDKDPAGLRIVFVKLLDFTEAPSPCMQAQIYLKSEKEDVNPATLCAQSTAMCARVLCKDDPSKPLLLSDRKTCDSACPADQIVGVGNYCVKKTVCTADKIFQETGDDSGGKCIDTPEITKIIEEYKKSASCSRPIWGGDTNIIYVLLNPKSEQGSGRRVRQEDIEFCFYNTDSLEDLYVKKTWGMLDKLKDHIGETTLFTCQDGANCFYVIDQVTVSIRNSKGPIYSVGGCTLPEAKTFPDGVRYPACTSRFEGDIGVCDTIFWGSWKKDASGTYINFDEAGNQVSDICDIK